MNAHRRIAEWFRANGYDAIAWICAAILFGLCAYGIAATLGRTLAGAA